MTAEYEFGPYRLDGRHGLLLRGSEPVGVGQRAVALLRLLVARAGKPVAKDELIAAAWPGLAVEDSNLTVQIAALRKSLGEAGGAAWIETLARRGYRWVGPAVTVREVASTIGLAGSPTLPSKPSIVVLPFADLGDDSTQAAFTDGMVDDIITGLARIKWLFVIGRGTTFALKGRALLPNAIGAELGVRYLLDGSVRKTGDRVRINCQLVDAASGAQVWAERYDRQRADIFELQDEIAGTVVGALEPGLKRAEIDRVKRNRPDSLDAYELVLEAQPDVDSGMPEQVSRALVHLERSLALLPTYALAHANAAMCHHCLYLRSGLKEENRRASLDHAQAATIYGQDDALALTYAGFSIGMDGYDRAAAFAAFEAALALSASSALTYMLGSVVLAWGGDAERAIDWGERGLRLSPFDPWAFAAHHALVLGRFKQGRCEEAVTAGYNAVRSNPAHSISHMLLAAALVRSGRAPEAKTAGRTVLQLQPGFRYSRQFAGANCEPTLASQLSDALDAAGLPA
ncbi:MAG: winged helix-turn-helix domain-containing protein [Proteobacteria bacterium]|nr:winged helix-turn-helix domain-containing protein [Pseudomonadota bacterium]